MLERIVVVFKVLAYECSLGAIEHHVLGVVRHHWQVCSEVDLVVHHFK
jgi:hypothetical protein